MTATTSTPTSIVASNVRAELARRRISQTRLAHLLKMSQPAVSKRLSGITPIDINDLFGIADALGVAPADLLTTSADVPPSAVGDARPPFTVP